MKTQRFLFYLSICILPFLAGCPERHTIITKVNRDGSCERIAGKFNLNYFEGIDSVIHDLPIPIDHSWGLDTINDTTVLLSKKFGTVKELNELYSHDKSVLSKSNRKVSLIKQFRWFYTVYKYSESFEGILTEEPLLTEYLTDDEIKIMKSYDSDKHTLIANLNEKSRKSKRDNIDERSGYWLHDHIFLMAFNDILDIADSLELIDKTKINREDLKNTIRFQMEEGEYPIELDLSSDMNMEDIAELMAHNLNMDSLATNFLAGEVKNRKLDELYEEEILYGIMEEYHNNLLMPGILVDTNAETIQGDTLYWFIHPALYIDSDFTMYAESRVTNLWAYYISGIIVLMAMIIPFIRKRK